MSRGITPRQPARTGRQDRVARALSPAKAAPKQSRGSKNARVGTGAPVRPRPGKASAPTARNSKPAVRESATTKTKGYNALAPDRIAEILKRLDQLYPDVTCALTHTSA